MRSLQCEFFACLATVRTSLPGRRITLFFQLLPPPFSPYFFAVTRFRTPGVTCCNLALARGEPARRSFPSLNSHRARVRRWAATFKRLNRTRAERRACLHVFAKMRVRLSASVYQALDISGQVFSGSLVDPWHVQLLRLIAVGLRWETGTLHCFPHVRQAQKNPTQSSTRRPR